jgi:acetamidase/formamidase
VETSFEVTITLSVEKRRPQVWPRAETAEDIITIGNARPLDQALQHATTEMAQWLSQDYGLDLVGASHLLGQVVRYDVANVFDPAYTVACRLPKRSLPAKQR